jgi:hypothetical protein
VPTTPVALVPDAASLVALNRLGGGVLAIPYPVADDGIDYAARNREIGERLVERRQARYRTALGDLSTAASALALDPDDATAARVARRAVETARETVEVQPAVATAADVEVLRTAAQEARRASARATSALHGDHLDGTCQALLALLHAVLRVVPAPAPTASVPPPRP